MYIILVVEVARIPAQPDAMKNGICPTNLSEKSPDLSACSWQSRRFGNEGDRFQEAVLRSSNHLVLVESVENLGFVDKAIENENIFSGLCVWSVLERREFGSKMLDGWSFRPFLMANPRGLYPDVDWTRIGWNKKFHRIEGTNSLCSNT